MIWPKITAMCNCLACFFHPRICLWRTGQARAWSRIALLCCCLPALTACRTKHEVDTTSKVELEVKPMHITIDVNVRVDRELENFFGDLDQQNDIMKGADQ